ncbi:MAG: PLP-dependent aspartate aminotransferase family protein [Pseudomonadota bacterium]
MSKKKNLAPETISAQALGLFDRSTGGVSPSIHMATTFLRDANYALLHPDHSYSRDENPTFIAAERVLCELEHGEDAMLFSSGMAAATAVLQILKPGDHVVAPRVMYWGLRDWLQSFCKQWNIRLDLFDPTDPDSLAATVRKGETRLVWIETPCNPTWDVIDIAAAAEVARSIGAKLAVDSTAATPVLTRPLQHGADFVMHSATKYLSGHSDVLAGAVVTANHDEHWKKVRDARSHGGAVPGSLEAWLLQRSMRTLHLRVRKSCESAMAIATHFASHPGLKAVLYPGLQSHAGHEIAKRQMDGGFGGMLSLRVNGDAERALEVCGRFEVFARATSLGGVESLVEHRFSIEGPRSPVPPDLIRVSVGIEAVEDLIDDLEHALG